LRFNCFLGSFGVQKNTTFESCPVGVQFPILIVIVAVVVFCLILIALTAVIMAIIVKYRKLSNDFTRLDEDQDFGNEKL
jgi:hypothetical protein